MPTAIRKNTPTRVTTADLSEFAREQLVTYAGYGQELGAVDPALIQAIVNGGALRPENPLPDETSLALAEKRFDLAKHRATIDAFCERLDAAGVSTRIPIEDRTQALTEVVFEYAFALGQASYLVGFAVGREMAGVR